MKELKYRTYVFVERHLSLLDKGIQAAHAVIEFYNEAKLWNKQQDSNNFDKWAHFDKSLILLNGGSVNDLMELDEILCESGIHHGVFMEPDLDNIPTAIAIVVDERVFNKEEYPDFEIWLRDYKNIVNNDSNHYFYNQETGMLITMETFYNEWLNFIGGEKILKLRELINNKKLAR